MGVPDGKSVVELFSYGESGEVPRLLRKVSSRLPRPVKRNVTNVTAHINVFCVPFELPFISQPSHHSNQEEPKPSSSQCRGLCRSRIDSINPKRLGISQKVNERLVGARLERDRVTSGSGVEGVYTGEDRVCVNTGATSTSVGGHEWRGCTTIPVGLEEAKNVVGLRTV